MADLLLTLGTMSIALLVPLIFGLPVCWLLRRRRPLVERDYLVAPFLGIALVVLLVQNLVRLDVPMRPTIVVLWLGAAIGWAALWRGGYLAAVLNRAARGPLALGLAVYLLNAIGLLLVGARFYYGRAWTDQFNYTILAQFLLDHPYSSRLADIVEQPYLALVVHTLKADRLGQSVLHAFNAGSSFLDAQVLLEPTILLGPPLVALAVWRLGVALGLRRKLAILAALTAGLLPATAIVHLEGFLSQSLGTGFLLLTLPLCRDVAAAIRAPDQPSDEAEVDGRLLPALGSLALVLAALAAIYTELLALALGSAILLLGVVMVLRRRPGAGGLVLLVVLGAPLLLNPTSFTNFLHILQRGAASGSALLHVYPWAFDLEGFTRLWLGDLAGRGTRLLGPLWRLYGLVVTVLGYFGLFLALVREWLGPDHSHLASRAPAIGLVAATTGLAAVPWLIVVRGGNDPYQFYKLLLSTTPLLVLGLALLLQAVLEPIPGPTPMAPGRRAWLPYALPVLVLGIATSGTLYMLLGTLGDQPAARYNGYRFARPAVRELQEYLKGLRDRDVLIAEQDWYLSAWLMYFARHNRVRVTNPLIVDGDLRVFPELAPALDVESLPAGTLVVTGTAGWLRSWPAGDSRLALSNDAFQVWELGTTGWALPLRLENRNGLEQGPEPLIWLGDGATTLTVLTPSAGTLVLDARFTPGPRAPSTAPPPLRLTDGNGYVADVALPNGAARLDVPVGQGTSTISLTPLGEPLPASTPNADPRPLMIGLGDLRLDFEPAAAP